MRCDTGGSQRDIGTNAVSFGQSIDPSVTLDKADIHIMKLDSDSAAQHKDGESLKLGLITISNPNGWQEERDVC
jgi:hypothetical protein